MKAPIFDRQEKQPTSNTPKHCNKQIFSSVRFRILAWYFVLTTCTVVVDVYIGHLRKKLGNNLIETVRGVGYRLRSDA